VGRISLLRREDISPRQHFSQLTFLLTCHHLDKLTQKREKGDGRLNLEGEIAIGVGVLALFFLLSPAVTTLPMMPKAIGGWRWKRNQRAGYIALALVVVHLVVLGIRGWLAPQGWNGGIPPVSLVAVVAALVPLLVKRRLEHDKKERAAKRAMTRDSE
jgi:DMSO/TMAO reductase YedYZ heme-binding membrane subunit